MQALRKVVVHLHGSFSITSRPVFPQFKQRNTTNLAEKYQTSKSCDSRGLIGKATLRE